MNSYLENLKELQVTADKLVGRLSRGPSGRAIPFRFSKAELGEKLDEDFIKLAAGNEMNVYLHIPSQMVFKLPHSDSWAMSTSELYEQVIETEIVIRRLQFSYGQLSVEKLSEFGVEYLTTYFLFSRGEYRVGIIAQPFMPEDRYEFFDIDSEKKKQLILTGMVSDFHAGNVVRDNETGRIFLLDCLMGVLPL